MTERRIALKRPLGSHKSLDLEVAVHPLSNGVIVVNYPGITGDIDGYNNKYGQVADFVQTRGIGTVVRMGNPWYHDLSYPQGMIDNLEYVLGYCLSHGEELSGKRDPILYLMGFSAGASSIAAVAANHDTVKKILLMAPSGDAGEQAVKRGLSKFKGELYVLIGDRDEVVGPEAGQTFYDLATAATKRTLIIVPNCDHQFKGERNGRIMSKAPLWAFAGDTTFPSPEDGKVLYR